jgi:hypothetical protein
MEVPSVCVRMAEWNEEWTGERQAGGNYGVWRI